MEEVVPELPLRDFYTGIPSPTTYQGDSHLCTPEQTVVTPPGISNTKSFNEEVLTSDINAHISYMDVNVNMGDGTHNPKVHLLLSFHHLLTHQTLTLPLLYHLSIYQFPLLYPNLHNHLHLNISSINPLHHYSYLNPPKVRKQFQMMMLLMMVSLWDHMLIQSLIQNRKLFMITCWCLRSSFRFSTRSLTRYCNFKLMSGRNYVSGIEVDVMLNVQEMKLCEVIEEINRNNEKRVKAQSSSFDGEIINLQSIARERNVLFVKDVGF